MCPSLFYHCSQKLNSWEEWQDLNEWHAFVTVSLLCTVADNSLVFRDIKRVSDRKVSVDEAGRMAGRQNRRQSSMGLLAGRMGEAGEDKRALEAGRTAGRGITWHGCTQVKMEGMHIEYNRTLHRGEPYIRLREPAVQQSCLQGYH
jgi:hypothetical protein